MWRQDVGDRIGAIAGRQWRPALFNSDVSLPRLAPVHNPWMPSRIHAGVPSLSRGHGGFLGSLHEFDDDPSFLHDTWDPGESVGLLGGRGVGGWRNAPSFVQSPQFSNRFHNPFAGAGYSVGPGVMGHFGGSGPSFNPGPSVPQYSPISQGFQAPSLQSPTLSGSPGGISIR